MRIKLEKLQDIYYKYMDFIRRRYTSNINYLKTIYPQYDSEQFSNEIAKLPRFNKYKISPITGLQDFMTRKSIEFKRSKTQNQKQRIKNTNKNKKNKQNKNKQNKQTKKQQKNTKKNTKNKKKNKIGRAHV